MQSKLVNEQRKLRQLVGPQTRLRGPAVRPAAGIRCWKVSEGFLIEAIQSRGRVGEVSYRICEKIPYFGGLWLWCSLVVWPASGCFVKGLGTGATLCRLPLNDKLTEELVRN